MFRDIPQAVQVTQGHLKALEAWRNAQGQEHRRLRQVTPETGKLLAILLAGCPAGDAAEVGTGAGFSALWLALACRSTGRRLTTFERDPAKAELARHSLDAGAVLDVVTVAEGDGVAGLGALPTLAFCLIDAAPADARPAYEQALARLVPGGLICVVLPEGVPANVVVEKKQNPDEAPDLTALPPDIIEFRRFLFDAEMDPRVDAVSLPVEGTSLLICRKVRP